MKSPEIRDRILQALKAEGIPSMVYYPRLMHPYLEEEEIMKVCQVIQTAVL